MVTNPVAVLQGENVRLKEENDALKEELRDLREFVLIIDELSKKADGIKDDSELLPLLRDILTRVLDLLDAPDGSLALLDEDKNELVFVIVLGTLASDLTGYRIPADEGIAGWVMKNREVALVRDVRRDTRFFADVDTEFKFRTQSIAAAPLIGNDKVYGVVEALNQPGDQPFSDSDVSLLKLLCRFAGEALANIERSGPISPESEKETT